MDRTRGSWSSCSWQTARWPHGLAASAAVLGLVVLIWLTLLGGAVLAEALQSTKLVTDRYQCGEEPRLSGDRVVWVGFGDAGSDVFTWTPAAGTLQLSDGDEIHSSPQVSGDRVAWVAHGALGSRVLSWTPSGGVAVVRDAGELLIRGLEVSGDRLVWTEFPRSEGGPAAASADASALATSDVEEPGSVLTWTPSDGVVLLAADVPARAQSEVDVSDDMVVWIACDGGDERVYAWTDEEGVFRLTDDSSTPSSLHVSKGRVVWADRAPGVSVLTWTAESGVVTLAESRGAFPQFSGDRVVWQQRRPNTWDEWDVYTWTPATGATRLTHLGHANSDPQVSGDRVVWRQYDGFAWHLCTWTPAEGVGWIVTALFQWAEPGHVPGVYVARIDGERVVWEQSGPHGTEVWTGVFVPGEGTLPSGDLILEDLWREFKKYVRGFAPQCNKTVDPVNTSTGNATYFSTDLALAGKGFDLALCRTYNSTDVDNPGVLGFGWTLSYSAHLEEPVAGKIRVVADDGHEAIFTEDEDGRYSAPEGVTDRLRKNSDGSFTLTQLDQSRAEFDPTGLLVALVDRYGDEVTFTHDEDGLLTQIEEPGGRSIVLTYSSGRLIEASDSAGRIVSYEYDARGDLIGFTDPNGHTTRYSYDDAHQLTVLSLPAGGVNPFMTNTYTGDKVTLQVDALRAETALHFDEDKQETIVTDARGNASVDKWDHRYRLVEHIDPLGFSSSISYNSAGFVQSTTDEDGRTNTFEYDALGNVVCATDPEGHRVTAAYDLENGNPLWTADAAGNKTEFGWDSTGLFLQSVTSPFGTTQFSYNPDGTVASVTDANSHTSGFEYDPSGQLIAAIDPLGSVSRYEYDSLGRLTAWQDPCSNRVEFTYDAKGNVLSIKDPLAQADPSRRHQIDSAYDANDRLTGITDARGNSTTFTYDAMNRLTGVRDALSGTATYTYDGVHNLTGATDPRGNTTSYNYDPCDRISAVVDPLGRQTTYAYGPAGDLAGVTYPNGKKTDFTYDACGRLAGVSHPGESTTYSYSYNPTGTLSSVERSDGEAWHHSYDAGSRLTSASDKNNPALGSLGITWAYDAVSNVTGLDVGGFASLGLTYDARDRLESFTDQGGVTSFAHDAAGRLTEIATPEGTTRTFEYDAAGRVTGLANATATRPQAFTYAYDENGNVLTENRATYTYDALDRLTGWRDPSTLLTTTYEYDPAGNITKVKWGPFTVQSFSYDAADQITNRGFRYDPNGNLTSDGLRKYSYDADNRLTKVALGPLSLGQMTYDHAGRRTSLARPLRGTTYFHYAGGLLVAESDRRGNVTATYAWSPEGGLISMTRGGKTYYYQTNAHGDVVSLTDSAGRVVNSYSYDPWGQILTASERVENPFRYASYYYDTSTGLYYLWHRYYDPGLKRFLSEDPAYLSTGERYRYCKDNPLAFVDPTGLAWYHIFNPFSDQNPLYKDAYENGASWVNHFNPVYVILDGYVTGIDIAMNGGSWWDSFTSCLYGATGVVDLCLPMLAAETKAAMVGSGFVNLSPKVLNEAGKAAVRSGCKGGVKAGVPKGRLGSPMNCLGLNDGAMIGGRWYSGHAIDRMQGRGLVPSIVEDTIGRGAATPGRSGRVIFTTDQCQVVVKADGTVVSAWPR